MALQVSEAMGHRAVYGDFGPRAGDSVLKNSADNGIGVYRIRGQERQNPRIYL